MEFRWQQSNEASLFCFDDLKFCIKPTADCQNQQNAIIERTPTGVIFHRNESDFAVNGNQYESAWLKRGDVLSQGEKSLEIRDPGRVQSQRNVRPGLPIVGRNAGTKPLRWRLNQAIEARQIARKRLKSVVTECKQKKMLAIRLEEKVDAICEQQESIHRLDQLVEQLQQQLNSLQQNVESLTSEAHGRSNEDSSSFRPTPAAEAFSHAPFKQDSPSSRFEPLPGATESGTEDVGTEDVGTEDAGTEDAGIEDAGTEDAGNEDAGTRPCPGGDLDFRPATGTGDAGFEQDLTRRPSDDSSESDRDTESSGAGAVDIENQSRTLCGQDEDAESVGVTEWDLMEKWTAATSQSDSVFGGSQDSPGQLTNCNIRTDAEFASKMNCEQPQRDSEESSARGSWENSDSENAHLTDTSTDPLEAPKPDVGSGATGFVDQSAPAANSEPVEVVSCPSPVANTPIEATSQDEQSALQIAREWAEQFNSPPLPGSTEGPIFHDQQSKDDRGANDCQASEPSSDDKLSVPATEKKTESVSDVLLRMREQGSLDESFTASIDIPAADASNASSAGNDSSIETTSPAGGLSERPAAEGSPEPSIQEYMDQLMSRLNQGRTQSHSPQPVQPEPQLPTDKSAAEPETATQAESEEVMSPEEFRPKDPAPEQKGLLDGLRQVANQSTQQAVTTSIKRKKLDLAQYYLVGGGIGVALAGVCFSLAESLTDAGGLLSVLCIAFAGFCFAKYFATRLWKPEFGGVRNDSPASHANTNMAADANEDDQFPAPVHPVGDAPTEDITKPADPDPAIVARIDARLRATREQSSRLATGSDRSVEAPGGWDDANIDTKAPHAPTAGHSDSIPGKASPIAPFDFEAAQASNDRLSNELARLQAQGGDGLTEEDIVKAARQASRRY